MPPPVQKTRYFQSLTDTPVPTTTETVALTMAGIITQGPNATVEIEAWLQLTIGTAATGLTFRLRRGSLTGTVVGEANAQAVTGAAGSTEDHTVQFSDTPGEVAGQVYVLTVQQAAATGNGTVLAANAAVGTSGA